MGGVLVLGSTDYLREDSHLHARATQNTEACQSNIQTPDVRVSAAMVSRNASENTGGSNILPQLDATQAQRLFKRIRPSVARSPKKLLRAYPCDYRGKLKKLSADIRDLDLHEWRRDGT